MQIDNDAGNLTYAIRHFFMLYVPVFWFSAMKAVLLQSNYKHKK